MTGVWRVSAIGRVVAYVVALLWLVAVPVGGVLDGASGRGPVVCGVVGAVGAVLLALAGARPRVEVTEDHVHLRGILRSATFDLMAVCAIESTRQGVVFDTHDGRSFRATGVLPSTDLDRVRSRIGGRLTAGELQVEAWSAWIGAERSRRVID